MTRSADDEQVAGQARRSRNWIHDLTSGDGKADLGLGVGWCRSSRQALIASGVVVDVVDRDVFFHDPIETLRVPLDPTDFPIVGTVNAEQFDGGLISITISVGDPQ